MRFDSQMTCRDSLVDFGDIHIYTYLLTYLLTICLSYNTRNISVT